MLHIFGNKHNPHSVYTIFFGKVTLVLNVIRLYEITIGTLAYMWSESAKLRRLCGFVAYVDRVGLWVRGWRWSKCCVG